MSMARVRLAFMLNLIRNSGLRFLWLTAIVFVLDQWTKVSVVEHIELYQSIEITGFFNLTYVRNYGAAFSFLADSGGWQRWFFTIIALVVSVVIIRWLSQTNKTQLMLPIAFCLILGGALGNVYDRLVLGYVVDFLSFYYNDWYFPAFNIADSAISLGAFLLIVDMFKNKEDESEKVND
jgi:signal peptidase II